MMWLLFLHLAMYIAVAATNGNGDCPEDSILVGNQCLLFVTYYAQYQSARDFCHIITGKLATITTANQFALIVDHIRQEGYSDRDFWMDGTDEAQEGQWLTSHGQLVPRGTPFWAGAHGKVQQPNNYAGSEDCMCIYADMFLYLNDCGCTFQKNFICEFVPYHRTVNGTSVSTGNPSPPGQGTSILLNHQPTNQLVKERARCPTLYVEVGGHCLLFMTWAEVNWNEASTLCGDTGELLAITDADLFREVFLYLQQEGISGDSFWLGGSDSAKEGTWVYTTGEPVPMGTPFWGLYGNKQEPDGGTLENCLLMDTGSHHYMRDMPCSSIAKPLCVYVG